MRMVNNTILTVIGALMCLFAMPFFQGLPDLAAPEGSVAFGFATLALFFVTLALVPGLIFLWAGVAGFMGRSAGMIGKILAGLVLVFLLFEIVISIDPLHPFWQGMVVCAAALILAFVTPSSLTLRK